MCLSCGQWWGSQIPLYDPPAKDETIYLDANHAFYPDERKYDDYNPSVIVNPYEAHWEDFEKWPRVYKYLSTHELAQQGLHPPAPIFQAGQGFNPGMFPYGMAAGAPYGYGGTCYPGTAASGWPYYSPTSYNFPYTNFSNTYLSAHFPQYNPLSPYMNSSYYSPFSSTNYYNPLAAALPYPYGQYGQYGQFPGAQFGPYGQFPAAQYPYAQYPYAGALGGMPQLPMGPSCSCPCAPLLNHASQILSANSQLAMNPAAPFMFTGFNQAEINAQNSILAAHYGMTPMAGVTAGMPSQVVPYKPAQAEQFWCRETNGDWILREQKDLHEGKILPGHWERHELTGYYYWIRH